MNLAFTSLRRLVAAFSFVAVAVSASGITGAGEPLATRSARCRAMRAEAVADVDRARPELRNWNGPLHMLMSDVGDAIAARRCRSSKVRELLGPPDEEVAGGGRHATVDVPRGETHWIYWWRGGHDYLYFVIRGGRVAEARWWFAGE